MTAAPLPTEPGSADPAPSGGHTQARSRFALTPMGEVLLHPAVLGSVAGLVANDHVLKARWPGPVTGKLSDVLGLVFFPVVLAALLEGARQVARRPRVRVTPGEWTAVVVLTAAAFTAVKASPALADAYSHALGWVQWPARSLVAVASGEPAPAHVPIRVLADATDLVALPALALAHRLGRGAPR